MLFNSTEFLFVFLPATLVLFYGLARVHVRLSIALLALASLAFYAWWDWHFLPILLASISVNYCLGGLIDGYRRQARLFLVIAIALNLAALVFYKYLDFLVISANQALGWSFPEHKLELPLGISFFTFTQIAWLVDTYQRKASERSVMNYLLFVTYFPHLIAGPILHHAQMMPQFAKREIFTWQADSFVLGLAFLTIGLVKKVFLADHFATYATPIFSHGESGPVALQEAWLGALAYSLQLYFDFSGYCDMALGISRMFNIDLPINFHSPYQSRSISEFWRRWHMTLSQFLREYLYIPLGGNRLGRFRRYVNLMVTMLLGGIWHGANWTFLLWGSLHGLFLVIQHGFSALRERVGMRALPTAIAWPLTLLAVVMAWVPFRASDWSVALTLWSAMFGMSGVTPNVQGLEMQEGFYAVLIGGFVVGFLPASQDLVERFRHRLQVTGAVTFPVVSGLIIGLFFSAAVLSLGHVSEFLYFQF